MTARAESVAPRFGLTDSYIREVPPEFSESELERQKAEFFSKGGKIKEIPEGNLKGFVQMSMKEIGQRNFEKYKEEGGE